MKKFVLLVLGMMLVASTVAVAQDDKSGGFWKSLMQKMQKVTPTKRSTATTAVGGVRGAKNDGTDDIYWKGKAKAVEVGEDEVERFNQALEVTKNGDHPQALKLFEAFLQDFPKSSLRAEGVQAVDNLKAELAARQAAPAVQAAK